MTQEEGANEVKIEEKGNLETENSITDLYSLNSNINQFSYKNVTNT